MNWINQASIDLRRALRRLRPHSYWHECSDWHHQDDLQVAEEPLLLATTGAERAFFLQLRSDLQPL